MPLPSDEKLLALSNDLLKEFAAVFGEHPAFVPLTQRDCCSKAHLPPRKMRPRSPGHRTSYGRPLRSSFDFLTPQDFHPFLIMTETRTRMAWLSGSN